MIHQLKTEHEFFEAMHYGEKPFEVRKNDRDFQVGDFLALNETVIVEEKKGALHVGGLETAAKSEKVWGLSGRCMLVRVLYVLEDERFCKDGFVTLGIEPCEISSHTLGNQIKGWGNIFPTTRAPIYTRSGRK